MPSSKYAGKKSSESLIMLNSVQTGNPSTKAPLLIVHGLFGSARNWGAIQKRLSDERLVIAVDMRNHGHSFKSPSHNYHDMAGDLKETLEPLVAEHGPLHVLGHSMGGKAAMALALTHADLLKSLIVADISPIAYQHDNTPLADAMLSLDLNTIERRSDADAQLANSITDPSVRAFLTQSLVVKEKRWLLNIAVLRQQMPQIVGWPEELMSNTGIHFEKPTFFLSGKNSNFTSPDHRAETKALFPNSSFASIADTGHWLHAEKPREFEKTVRYWMNSTD